MGIVYRLWLAAICVLSFSGRAETLSSEEWGKWLLQVELPEFETRLRGLSKSGEVPAVSYDTALSVLQQLKQDLQKEPRGGAPESVRYLALSNYLATFQLAPLCEEEKTCLALVAEARAHSFQAVETLATRPLSDASFSGYLALLRRGEAASETAQKKIVLQRRRRALKVLALSFQSLAELDESARTDLERAESLIRQAMEEYEGSNESAADQRVRQAMRYAFGELVDKWDSHHLMHYLGLRTLVAVLLQSDALDANDKTGLAEGLRSVQGAPARPEYEKRANELKTVAMAHIASKHLDERHSEWAVYLAPYEAMKNQGARLRALGSWVPEAKKSYLENETFLQSLYRSAKREHLSVLEKMGLRFAQMRGALKETDRFEVLKGYFHSAAYLQTLTQFTLEAVLDHSASASQYFEVWMRATKRLMQGQPFMNPADYALIQDGLKTERREGVRRAWVNRKNASVAALSVLLAAEAIAIPFSGGGSAAAMPATLQAITTFSVATAKGVLVANSSLNILDRAKSQGVRGLANLDTAFDALVILSLTPRPMVGGPVAKTAMGRFAQSIPATFAGAQYAAGGALTVGSAGYGAYLFWNADALSQEMQKEGIVLSPGEIRRKGAIYMAISLLSLRENTKYYEKGVKTHGKSFEKEIEPATFTKDGLSRFLGQFNQLGKLRQIYSRNPGIYGALKVATRGLGYAALDYALLTEAGMLSYANLDSRYLNHVFDEHPMPDLADGETAVIAVGFEPSDYFLYAGAQAKYSNRREIEKYGSRVYLYDYRSPEDLMNILDRHAHLYGPVRYLKISTHGRPGRLFTGAVLGSPEGSSTGSGWIDEAWLQQNHERLQSRSRSIFAPDARVVLWACLVGANLDEDQGEGTDVGERFIHQLGTTWLVNGGAIDASTRLLLGGDATLGSALDYSLKQGLSSESPARPSFVLPISPLEAGVGSTGTTALDVPWGAKLQDTMENAKAMGKRLYDILTFWPPVWWEFGVNLEGPFWQSRYRYEAFPAQVEGDIRENL